MYHRPPYRPAQWPCYILALLSHAACFMAIANHRRAKQPTAETRYIGAKGRVTSVGRNRQRALRWMGPPARNPARFRGQLGRARWRDREQGARVLKAKRPQGCHCGGGPICMRDLDFLATLPPTSPRCALPFAPSDMEQADGISVYTIHDLLQVPHMVLSDARAGTFSVCTYGHTGVLFYIMNLTQIVTRAALGSSHPKRVVLRAFGCCLAEHW